MCTCMTLSDLISFMQVVKMLVVVMVVFTVCTVPRLLFNFWQSTVGILYNITISHENNAINFWLSLLSFVKSSVNAFIYYWSSE